MRFRNTIRRLVLASTWIGFLAAGAWAADPAPSSPSVTARPTWKPGPSSRYVITAEEDRQCDGPASPAYRLSLNRVIYMTLTPSHINADGSGAIRCTLDRIELTGQSGGRPIRYDSSRDKPGQGNPVADLLSNLVGQEIGIRLGKGGEFVEVSGLNGIWRGKGLLAAPAGLVSIQFLFRDHAMLDLLRQTLSPPLAADLSKPGTAWQAPVPGEITGVTMLESASTFTVVPSDKSVSGDRVHVLAEGGLRVVRPAGDVGEAGLRSSVVTGERRADLTLDATTHQVVSHEIEQDLTLAVRLIPPAGGDTPSLTMRQKLKTSAMLQHE